MPRDDAALLFAGTANAYAAYRPGYSAELFDRMAVALGFADRTRVADLGCGPGTATIPLAPRGGPVVAIDPNPEMLDVARAAANRARTGNIEFRQGTAEDLPTFAAGEIEHAVF